MRLEIREYLVSWELVEVTEDNDTQRPRTTREAKYLELYGSLLELHSAEHVIGRDPKGDARN